MPGLPPRGRKEVVQTPWNSLWLPRYNSKAVRCRKTRPSAPPQTTNRGQPPPLDDLRNHMDSTDQRAHVGWDDLSRLFLCSYFVYFRGFQHFMVLTWNLF